MDNLSLSVTDPDVGPCGVGNHLAAKTETRKDVRGMCCGG